MVKVIKLYHWSIDIMRIYEKYLYFGMLSTNERVVFDPICFNILSDQWEILIRCVLLQCLPGVQIMYSNGVSHKTEKNDAEGIGRILHWLSYMPHVKASILVNSSCIEL